MTKGEFSFAYFCVLICLLIFPVTVIADQTAAGRTVGATLGRAKLEKKSKAMEQILEQKKTEPVIEGEAAVVDQADIDRAQAEKEDIRSRVIS